MYEVEITPEGLRHLVNYRRRWARAGKPLRGELEGLYSARRGEFRRIYEIDEDAEVVLIHRAPHGRRTYQS